MAKVIVPQGLESKLALASGAIAVAIAEVAIPGGIAQNLLQVGAPAVIGSCAADFLTGYDSDYKYATTTLTAPFNAGRAWKRALIAGGVGTGVLVAAGAYQFQADLGSLSFVLLIGGSAVAASYFLDESVN